MSVLTIQIKRISAFIYVLIFLLGFNVLFNLMFQWYGISLIVRVYLFVFCFYLIYNYAAFETERLRVLYSRRFGDISDFVIFFEMGIVPFLIIYGVTGVFTFIDYLRLPHWPWNPFLSLLNGRYSNLVIYSLLLFLILKLKKGPGVKIAIFIGVSVAYYFVDKILYTIFFSSPGIGVVKVLKLVLLISLLFFEFMIQRSRLFLVLMATVLSITLVITAISANYLVFRYSGIASFQKKESGLVLLRFGFEFPYNDLKTIVTRTGDMVLFSELLDHAAADRYRLNYSDREWEELFLSGDVELADTVAGQIEDRELEISFEKIVNYAYESSLVPEEKIERASNIIALAARHAAGKRDYLQEKIPGANRNFKLWGIAVLGMTKEPGAIPFLMEYLTDIDSGLVDASYESLRTITGSDPAQVLNMSKNDPEVISKFKQFYLRNRRGS